MKFSSTAITTLAITASFGKVWGFLAEQEQADREHTFARICDPRPSPQTEPSPSAFPSTAPVEVPTTSPVPSTEPSQFPSLEPSINPTSSQAPTPTCMPKFENFDEVCEQWLQNNYNADFLAAPSCRTPCEEWEGLPEANFVVSGDGCRNCIADENGDEYCIDISGDEYRFFYSPSSDWNEWAGGRSTFRQSGSLSSGSTVQFLVAYNYSAYRYSQVDSPEYYACRVAVDGMECNSCTYFFNTTEHVWWDVDCSNTPSIDSPTRVDLGSDNTYREPTIGYDHPLFAMTDRATRGICYNEWFPEEEQAPSAAPVQGGCVPTSGFDEELCEWHTAGRSYLQCLNPCDDWVGEIRSNIAFLESGCSGCYEEDNGEEYCVEEDHTTYFLSRDFNASAAAEWSYRSWARMELGYSRRFNQSGLASSGAVVEYIRYSGFWPEECDVKIDGQLCNSCTSYSENDYDMDVQHRFLTVDCSNVDGVDAVVSFNLTDDWSTSYTLEFYRGLLEPEVPMDHPLFALTARVQHDCGRLDLPSIDEAPSAAPVEGDCDPESGYDQELCNWRFGGNCANPCDDWPGEIRSNIVGYPGWYDCSGCVNEGDEVQYCLDMTHAEYYLSFGFNASDPSWNDGTDYLDLGDAYIFNSSGINSRVVTLTYDLHDYYACWVTVNGEYCDSCVEKEFRIYPVEFRGIEVDCRNLGIGDAPFQFNYQSNWRNSNDPEVPMNHPLFALTNRARFGVCEGFEEGRLPATAHDKPAVVNDQDRQHRPFMPWRRFGNIHPDEGGRV